MLASFALEFAAKAGHCPYLVLEYGFITLAEAYQQWLGGRTCGNHTHWSHRHWNHGRATLSRMRQFAAG
jgi:hypothetical protein